MRKTGRRGQAPVGQIPRHRPVRLNQAGAVPWRRYGIPALVDRLSPVFASYQPLGDGGEYVCVRGGRLERLVVERSVDIVNSPNLPAEGTGQILRLAEVRLPSGQVVTVSRGDVLWPARDHAAIAEATRVLGLPLVPRTRRPTPTWKLGRARVNASALAALGRWMGGP